MKSLTIVCCIAIIVGAWFLGDARLHGPMFDGTLTPLMDFLSFAGGAALFGMIFGLVFDSPRPGSRLGLSRSCSGVHGISRWALATIGVLLLAGGVGWVVETYFRHMPQDLMPLAVGWHATAMLAVMFTLIRPALPKDNVQQSAAASRRMAA